jgi:O-antigen ligase
MIKFTHAEIDSKAILLLSMVVLITITGGLIITKASAGVALAVIAAVVIGIVSFINTEIALYILIASMLLGPQFIVGGPTPLPGRGRPFTMRMDDILLVIIGLSWFLKTAIRKELGLFTRTPLNGPITYYFFVCIISTLFGYMMGRVTGITGFFFVLKYFEYFVIYFIAVNHLKEKKQIERFLFTMLAVCFIVCIIAIAQIPTTYRVSAPFEGSEGEPNTFGGYLVLMLSIVLGLLLTYGSKKQKFILGMLSFLIAITLAATLSRASWISLIPMVMTLLYFSRRKLPIIVTLIIITLIASFMLPTSIKERALFTFDQPKEKGQVTIGNVRLDTSTSDRIKQWKNILQIHFIKHPILGYGIRGGLVDAQYARVLAETGLLGLITFLILLFFIYMNAFRAYRYTADPLFSGLSLGYLAGFFAMVIHGIGTNTFIIVRIMEPFWFLTAMIIMIPEIETAVSKEPFKIDTLAA